MNECCTVEHVRMERPGGSMERSKIQILICFIAAQGAWAALWLAVMLEAWTLSVASQVLDAARPLTLAVALFASDSSGIVKYSIE